MGMSQHGVGEKLTFSLEQFRNAFPAIEPNAAAALFVRDSLTSPRLIERILTDHGITEPPAVVHFLAVCGLASDDFTNFNKPIYGLDALEWLAARAREWESLKLSEEANDWQTDFVIQNLPDTFALPGNWPAIWRVLDRVCEALGVAQPTDGADEMSANG